MSTTVVDELVVRLSLLTDDYEKQQKKVDSLVSASEKKLRDADDKRKKRSEAWSKQQKESLKSVKDLASGMRGLALTVGSLLGVGGGAAGIVGMIAGLAGVERGLSKLGVGTGMSNRSLAAWGSAAKRMGLDAEGAQSAIAGLAKEAKNFRQTGQAPTLGAFARIGVRAGVDSKPEDVLAQAQQIYRQSAPAQQKNIESTLSASGVAPELIQIVTSSKDVLKEYGESFAETVSASTKGLDAFNVTVAALETASRSLANTLTTVAEPYLKQLGDWAQDSAKDLADFSTRVEQAGGGIDGFRTALAEKSPGWLEVFDDVAAVFRTLKEAVDLSAYGLKLMAEGAQWLFKKFDSFTGGSLGKSLAQGIGTVIDAVKWSWTEGTANARVEGPLHLSDATQGVRLTPGAQARIAAIGPLDAGEEVVDMSKGAQSAGAPALPAPGGNKGTASMSDIVQMLVAKGLSIPQAFGLAANFMAESSLKPNALSDDKGAAGLAQWRGSRRAAFKAENGFDLTQASAQQQIDWMFRNPAERAQLMQAIAGRNTPGEVADGVTRIFEKPGKGAALDAEARKRADMADSAYRNYQSAGVLPGALRSAQRGGASGGAGSTGGASGTAAGNGPTYNIQNMSVNASNPAEFADGMKRVSNTSSYGSAVR